MKYSIKIEAGGLLEDLTPKSLSETYILEAVNATSAQQLATEKFIAENLPRVGEGIIENLYTHVAIIESASDILLNRKAMKEQEVAEVEQQEVAEVEQQEVAEVEQEVTE